MSWWKNAVLVWLLVAALSGIASAQDAATTGDLTAEVQRLASEVDALEKNTLAPTTSDAGLAANRVAFQKLSQAVFAVALKASASLSQINEQTTALGPLPEQGAGPEPETVAAERQRLAALKGETALLLRETEKLAVRISSLIETVAKLRSEKFVDEILARHPMSADVWTELRSSLDIEWRRLRFAFSNWFRILEREIADRTVTAAAMIVGVAIALVFAMRRFARPLISRPAMSKQQPYLRRVFSALSTTVIPSLAVAIFAAVFYVSLKQLGLLPPRVDEMVRAIAIVASVLTFVFYLTNAVLAPGRKHWRVFTIYEPAARRLTVLITILSVIYAGDYLFAEMRAAMGSPVAYTVFASFVSTLLFAGVLSLVLLTRLTEEAPAGLLNTHGWAPWFYWPMWIAIAVIVVAALGGYVSLARFLAGQIVVTGAILVAMYIGTLSARAVAGRGALGKSSLGFYLHRRLQFSDLSIDQLGLVTGALLLFGVLAVGVPAILLQWGFQQDDVQSWLSRVLGGFNIGDVRISFGNIALALIVFVAGVILTRMFQRWLAAKILTRTRLDAGAKNSIGAGVGYVGFILAALIALDYTGIDLSNLALIAGALSVGIGFGLQNVVNNFVSGLILLVERPIRVGDWIVVGTTQGYVKKISVRATELETFDRQSILIPNAELINTSVGNWMLKDNIGRLIVTVGVSYDADEEQVRDIFYRLIEEDERIATDPAPYVYFKDFGDNALIFELRVFLNNVSDVIRVGGDLRFAIRRAFREAGIAIPYPQRDIHVHSVPPQNGATVEGKDEENA